MRTAAFTLVEMIAAIVVIALIAGTTSMMVAQAGESYARASQFHSTASDAAFALERIAAVLQSVPAQAGAPGTPAFADLADSSFLSTAGHRVRLVGSELRMTLPNEKEAVLATGVDQVQFTYYDGQSTVLNPDDPATLDLIRRVGVRLVIGQAEAHAIVTPRAALPWRSP